MTVSHVLDMGACVAMDVVTDEDGNVTLENVEAIMPRPLSFDEWAALRAEIEEVGE